MAFSISIEIGGGRTLHFGSVVATLSSPDDSIKDARIGGIAVRVAETDTGKVLSSAGTFLGGALPAEGEPLPPPSCKDPWKTAKQVLNTAAVATPAVVVASLGAPTIAATAASVGMASVAMNELTKVR